MLKDLVREAYLNGYNCAESILKGANDYYHLGLDDKALRLVAGFGGGMQVADTCGALTGAACAVSSKYVETKAHDCAELAPIMQELIACFDKHFNSRDCADIRPVKFKPGIRCCNTVCEAADILENVLAKYTKA